MRFVAAAVVMSLLTAAPVCAFAAATAPGAPVPAVIAQATSFRGSLSYSAYSADDPSVTISGLLVMDARGFTLDERSPSGWLHVSSGRSWMRSAAQTVFFDDPFQLDALANSWAAMLVTSPGASLAADPGGFSWSTDAGERLYLDPGRTTLVGLVDLRSGSGVSFAYSDFIDLGSIRAPRSVVRMRGGTPDGSYRIDDYRLTPYAQPGPLQADASGSGAHAQAPAALATVAIATAGAWRWSTILALLMVVALGVVAWARRDAIVERLARHQALDPRAWRSAATTVLVSPEGTICFEGRPYRVGAEFYNRRALIQTSPLFIRVSAPETSRVLILARKFSLARGFTLVETLAASVLFATVIVAVVAPTLIVLAHADRMAAQRQRALQVATNALTDEQTALAYEPSGVTTATIVDETKTATVNGLALIETVAPAGVSELHGLSIEVRDASGATLARIVTQIGPPVPAPTSGGSGGGAGD